MPTVINNLVVISDTHCGCRLALCPVTVALDDGGTYQPSKFQRKLWAFWREFWDEWVPEVTRGEPYNLVHNGDAIDGVHHQSTTQISHNIQDQIHIAQAILQPEVDKCRATGGSYFHIRGTEAHVGKSGQYEEQLARLLGAVPNEEGQYARYDLWKRVGESTRRVKAPLVHLLHHIGTSSSRAHESSAINAEIAAEFGEAAQWEKEPPHYVVRSHRHRYMEVRLPTARGYAVSAVTPAWQGKTPFTWKISGARLTEPQIGGLIIRRGDEEHYMRSFVKTFERSREE